nr:hypothetical protein [Saccharopolyspora hordei]
MLLNLVTVHVDEVSALLGPVHGTAYLVVIAATFLVPAPPSARWLAVVPGVGGFLALRRTTRSVRSGR